jgi:hypothetical protein
LAQLNPPGGCHQALYSHSHAFRRNELTIVFVSLQRIVPGRLVFFSPDFVFVLLLSARIIFYSLASYPSIPSRSLCVVILLSYQYIAIAIVDIVDLAGY